jgi:hypothetical protein
VADIDGDNDLDVAATGYYAHDVVWYENSGGTSITWIRHNIDTDLLGAWEIRDADLAQDILLPEGVVFSVRHEDGEKSIRATTHVQIMKSFASSTEKMLERMWEPKVLIHKEIAVVWTKYDFHREGKFSHCGVDAFNLIKTPQGWKIAGIIYTVEKEGCEESPLGPPGKKTKQNLQRYHLNG